MATEINWDELLTPPIAPRARERARFCNLPSKKKIAKRSLTVMENVQTELTKYKEDNHLSIRQMSQQLGVAPKTLKGWIGPYTTHKEIPDLRWESLFFVCIKLNKPLEFFLKGTKYEGKMPLI